MTRFNRWDHDDALRACHRASKLKTGANREDLDTLSRAAASWAGGYSESLTRASFDGALMRVNEAIDAALVQARGEG